MVDGMWESVDTLDRLDRCLLDVWVLFQPVWIKMTFSLWIESYAWFCDFDDAFDCVIVGMNRVFLTIFKLLWMVPFVGCFGSEAKVV